MPNRQVRIFAPASGPYASPLWAETILGKIIKPLVLGHPTRKPVRYHFFRYRTGGWDDTDCEMALVPEQFVHPIETYHSIRFRYSMRSDWTQQFEDRGQKLIVTAGCLATHWLDYDKEKDLGGERFLSPDRDHDRHLSQFRRVQLVEDFLHVTSRLVLDCLIGPDEKGNFEFEKTKIGQNAQDSPFESLHHLFCNITQVPLRVRVPQGRRDMMLGTDYYPQGLVNWYQYIPIRF